MSVVRTLADTDGSLIVRKVATDHIAVARLEREARALRLASHPGVVSIVRYTQGEEGNVATLDTRFVATHTLATLCCRTPAELAQTVAALATTLADLHGVGVIHGAIHPTHIVLDHTGNPVLCGWASGGLLGETLEPSAPDPTSAPHPSSNGSIGPRLRPSRDVYALGRLLQHLADPNRCGFDPRSRRHRAAVERLTDLASLACSSNPDLRPSARAMADRLRSIALGEANIGDTGGRPTAALGMVESPGFAAANDTTVTAVFPATTPRHGTRQRHRSTARWPTIAAALGLITVAAGATLRPASPGAEATPTADVASTADIPTTLSGSTTVNAPRTTPVPLLTQSAPAVVCEAALVPITPPYPAPACTASVSAPHGLLVGDLRYRLGEPTDEILIADWRCRGTPQVAVLRPSTGEVHEFAAWASPGAPVRSARIASLPQGSHLETGPVDSALPAGCLPLISRQSDGHITAIITPRGTP